MIRVCAVVCGNGLGHLRRTLEVASALSLRLQKLQLKIVCASWQMEALARWQVVRGLSNNPHVILQYLDLYPRWSTQLEYYRNERLLDWHESLKPLDLGSYDLVVSDNLVEPLFYQPRTVLMGSFLWHDIYRGAFGTERVVEEYWRVCVRLLEECGPAIITNRYFAMPAVKQQLRRVEVGMLPPVGKSWEKEDDHSLGILFVAGSGSPIVDSMRSFLPTLPGRNGWLGHPARWFVDRAIAKDTGIPRDVSLFDYDADSFSRIDAVIGRPGMGAITDCVGTKTPMFCLHEPNPEMDHNAQTLERLGLGWRSRSLEGCLEQIGSYFADAHAQVRYQKCVTGLDRCGLEQTVEALTDYLNWPAQF